MAFNAAPKRMRSPVVRMCLVDIASDIPTRAIREHRCLLIVGKLLATKLRGREE